MGTDTYDIHEPSGLLLTSFTGEIAAFYGNAIHSRWKYASPGKHTSKLMPNLALADMQHVLIKYHHYESRKEL